MRAKGPLEIKRCLADNATGQEIYRLVVQGYSNKQIARKIGLAEMTVKYYVQGIFSNHGVKTRTQLVYVVLTGDRPESLTDVKT